MNNSGENMRRSGPLRRDLRHRLLCCPYCAAGWAVTKKSWPAQGVERRWGSL